MILGLVGAALVPSAKVRGEEPPRQQQDQIDQLRHEADATLLRGEFDRARHQFEEILKLIPNDASAERDAARAAQAAGEFEYAAQALEKAHHFADHKADPEIHYLRGEALYTLDRPGEAAREHRIAELEIGPAPTERMTKLWLARIYARRGWVVLADRLYEPMWPAAPTKDSEVALNQADGHLMNKDWTGGAAVLRRYLEREPKNVRAREMLAWAYEASGQLDDELPVRRSLVEDQPTGTNQRDYGRALERAAEYRAARDHYGAAIDAGAADPDGTLRSSFERMRYRVTPEVGGGLQFRSDPQAYAWHLQAGGAVPFGKRHQVSVLGWRDQSTDWVANLPNYRGLSTLRGTGSVTGLGASLFLGGRADKWLVLNGDVRFVDNHVEDTHGIVYRQSSEAEAGAALELNVPFFGVTAVNLRGDFNELWADAPITIHEGGATSGLTGHLFVFPTNRILLVDTGAQLRRVTIDPQAAGGARPAAEQELLWAGVDFNLWTTPTRTVRGEMLDERLVRGNYLNDAGVLAYRHYELFTQTTPDFRVSLAPRASIDIGSLFIRKAIADGRAGLDLRGGAGWDNQRQRFLAQGAVALVLAASWSSRFFASYELYRESATGIPGTLHIAWLTYHADI